VHVDRLRPVARELWKPGLEEVAKERLLAPPTDEKLGWCSEQETDEVGIPQRLQAAHPDKSARGECLLHHERLHWILQREPSLQQGAITAQRFRSARLCTLVKLLMERGVRGKPRWYPLRRRSPAVGAKYLRCAFCGELAKKR